MSLEEKKQKYTNSVAQPMKNNFAPSVFLLGAPGHFVEGVLGERREIPAKGMVFYDLAILDTNGKVTKRDGDQYVETDVEEGGLVSIKANIVLDKLLQAVPVGTTVLITYTGKQKNKGIGSTNIYTVNY